MQKAVNSKNKLILHVSLALSVLISLFVFLKIAWISEDAYIIFRSIQQFFEGNGPIWNPHERVQVFTSPLWFWVLVLIHTISADVYLNAIVLSLLIWFSILFILRKIFGNDLVLLFSILLLTASNGFFDYTSSGLENVLAYLVIALFLLNYLKLFSDSNQELTHRIENRKKTAIWVLVSFGVISCVRLDLFLLLLPATIYAIWKNYPLFSRKQWSGLIFLSLLPIILWSLFSLFYYGFPFPNTAYAKLNTQISKIALFKQGFNYYLSSLKHDFITLVIIGGSLIYFLFKSPSEKFLKYINFGIILHLSYIVFIGGDFMRGRFFSFAYLISVILLSLHINRIPKLKIRAAFWILISAYLIIYPHTPFNSPIDYGNDQIEMGIADERGIYFRALSFNQYFLAHQESTEFPAHIWCKDGINAEPISVTRNVGMYGYCAGIDKIIIDPLAITDPLLARIPIKGQWRVGHYPREIPPGYLESIIADEALIENNGLNEYYQKIALITQSEDLLDANRLEEIILINFGKYDYLIKAY